MKKHIEPLNINFWLSGLEDMKWYVDFCFLYYIKSWSDYKELKSGDYKGDYRFMVGWVWFIDDIRWSSDAAPLLPVSL